MSPKLPQRSRSSGPPAKPAKQTQNSSEAEVAELGVAAQFVPMERISLPESQPRRYFDEAAMQQLTASVQEHGILQPIIVRPVGEKYEVVAGERRYRAAMEVGLTQVPALVREMSDEQAIQYALVENLQREDLNPVEETEGILQLLALRLGCDPAGVAPLLYRMENEAKGKITQNVLGNSGAETVEQVFAELGRISWQSFTHARLPLLKLPANILEALREGRIEYTKALEIAKLESDADRMALLEEAIEQSLSLSQIRERVKAKKPPVERDELQTRLEKVYYKVKKLKVWDSPSKRQKFEFLLAEMEALLSGDD
ncbi:MAG: ParB/RepB/Spo0J family partition protein [Oscillatoria princeps RMCB-10]|nr:ParB/RepB/Spo0J family partition protein [Oscillatoria princeps RMCB-10]